MRFIDFTMKQLVGKSVLWTIGGQGKGDVRTITKIKACLSSGFTIECDNEGRIFNYYNGYQKALTGRVTHTYSFCKLIDEKDIDSIKEKWKIDNERITIIEWIKSNINNLSHLTIDQLKSIQSIIQK